jgi:hypothetical protein
MVNNNNSNGNSNNKSGEAYRRCKIIAGIVL